jgi:hypothetical protein
MEKSACAMQEAPLPRLSSCACEEKKRKELDDDGVFTFLCCSFLFLLSLSDVMSASACVDTPSYN